MDDDGVILHMSVDQLLLAIRLLCVDRRKAA